MQYLPHNAQQGPIQYLQLIPTRPLIVPISPYIPPNFNSQYSNSPTPQASSTSPYSLPHHSYSSSPQQTSSSYGSSAYGSGSYGSGSYGSGSYGSSYSPSLQNPIGGYSTNYLTYSIRPNHGMQLVNGPLDLSLNTNEYIPIQNENTYKMRRVWMKFPDFQQIRDLFEQMITVCSCTIQLLSYRHLLFVIEVFVVEVIVKWTIFHDSGARDHL